MYLYLLRWTRHHHWWHVTSVKYNTTAITAITVTGTTNSSITSKEAHVLSIRVVHSIKHECTCSCCTCCLLLRAAVVTLCCSCHLRYTIKVIAYVVSKTQVCINLCVSASTCSAYQQKGALRSCVHQKQSSVQQHRASCSTYSCKSYRNIL
jgi:hypothetical protein